MPTPTPNDDGTRAISPNSVPLGSASDPSVPVRIGRFEVRSLLGEGAFGRVYLAFDAELERQVAIKVPKPEGFTADMRERFIREARATAKIRHPNVCPVYEVGAEGELPYIVMHYQPGTTLAGHLDRWKVLPPLQAAALAQKLALGIAAAHDEGVIHRDLKPQNVLFDPTRQLVLITDFGLARITTQASETLAGAVFGTPLYMSPEQARGRVHEVGPLSDVYSLGVIFYRMITGDVPFKGETVLEVLTQHCEDEPVAPSAARRGLDPRLDRLCLKAMAKKPADRYPSAKAFADALGEYARGDSTAWQKPIPGGDRKPADPIPQPPPSPPPMPPRPLHPTTAGNDRRPPQPPTLIDRQEPERPSPAPEPLSLDEPTDGGATRQKVLLAGVGVLFLLILGVGIVIFVTSKPAPKPAQVNATPPDEPPPKKPDEPPPVKKPDEPPKKEEPPSIKNGFAGHKFDQTAERRAAEWVLGRGGELDVTPTVGAVRINVRKDDLPDQFTVARIQFRGLPTLTDAEVAKNLAGLTGPVRVLINDCGEIGDDTARALARIPRLTGIKFLRTSRVTDAAVEALAGHPELFEVDLQVTGVTKAGVKRLTTLPRVRKLTLGVPDTDEWLADLAPLTELTHLSVLVGGRALSERGMPHLKPFTKLRHLAFFGRATTDAWIPRLLEIGAWTELEELILAEAGIDGPGLAHLSKFPRLDWVLLDESRVRDDGLAHLVNVPRLGYLFLDNTSVGDDGLREVGKCKNLQILTLRDNKKITDKGLAHLSACKVLRELSLNNTDIGDTAVPALTACKALKKLNLTGTNVTAKGVAELKKALPACEVIHATTK